jgi:hypothetical protein
MKGKPWTEEENQYIRDNYEVMSVHDIAKNLERKMELVRKQASRLGVKKFPKEKYIGKEYERLTIESFESVRTSGGMKIIANCKCSCGNKKQISFYKIKNGKTRSCGCLQSEATSAANKLREKHGEAISELYCKWNSMIHRCHKSKKNSIAYKHYRGKGISVCDGWHTYENFRDWCLQNGFTEGKNLEIDRKKNNLGYCPENCRIVTRTENSRNKTNNRILTIFGIQKTMIEWSEHPLCAVQYKTLARRISMGENHFIAFSEPPRNKKAPS